MLKRIPTAPPDAIFGLSEAFRADARDEKINLVVGVYQDEQGKTPILQVVKEAERRLVESEPDKTYLPIEGRRDYAEAVRTLLLGAGHPALNSGRAVTAHTPGGTGALRVFADFLASNSPSATVWLSDVTWANHPKIFEAAGLEMASYPYFDSRHGRLDFAAMTERLAGAERGDVVLLQGVCHNPSGVDPSSAQWRELAKLLAARGLFPLIDIAYQGFGDDLDRDAYGVRHLAETLSELAICSSFSKILGLYSERVGGLTVIAETAEAAQATLSQIRTLVRTNYSNPPSHGSAIAELVLHDPGLRARWEEELAAMRCRIAAMRRQFADRLEEHGVRLRPGGNEFIVEQRGMFSFAGLTAEQVAWLRRERAIYMVSSGRINVAGINPGNVDVLARGIADCLEAVPGNGDRG